MGNSQISSVKCVYLMKLLRTALLFVVLLAPLRDSQGQDFVNLDFENPILPLSPFDGIVSAANAIPGWAAYYGPSGNPTESGVLATIYYNGLSLGGEIVALQDTNAAQSGVPLPIDGNYSVLLEGSIPFAASTASIGQIGTIPATAQSLTFILGDVFGNLQVTFNGQSISYNAIGNGANYTIYGADISSYAGQTGQLLFTAPVNNRGLLDDIQFSSTAIPEPSTFSLFGIGTLFFCWRVKRPNRRSRRR